MTEQERGAIFALACAVPPGKPVRLGDELAAVEPEQEAQWSLDALVRAAQEQGIPVERSQIRRILLQEGVRWRHPRTWAESTDPEFVPADRRPLHRPARGNDDPLPRRARTGEPAHVPPGTGLVSGWPSH
ncbi:hypothetical protein [Nitrolancea hollandica]|uniref:hypothetical protein n=1 Tax=Nitrolancea hollandica TaxID=1206749 RepID=UPI0034DEF250